MNLVQEYIKDLKVEGIKLQLQICSPHAKTQRNDILGNFDIDELDSVVAIKVIRDAIEQIQMVSSYDELSDLFKKWNEQRTIIQYQGYFFDRRRKTEAWCLVFLKRVLRKKHPELRKIIFGR